MSTSIYTSIHIRQNMYNNPIGFTCIDIPTEIFKESFRE